MPADTIPDSGLESLADDKGFVFSCSCANACFNLCCAELTLPLTPYDVLRLGMATGLACEPLLKNLAEIHFDPETGFPGARLKMLEDPLGPCPFVRSAGCSVYPHRPGACRAYPLGRGASLAAKGVQVRYYMVREAHCKGFGKGHVLKPAEWFKSQGLEPYNRSNDQLMRLICMVRATGRPLDARLRELATLALYNHETFGQILLENGLLEHLELPQARRALVCRQDLPGLEARLELAIDWLELMVFGSAKNLLVRQSAWKTI